MGGGKPFFLRTMLLSACWVLGISEQIVTPTRDLTGLVCTFVLTSIPTASQYGDGAGPSRAGSSSPAARKGVGSWFITVGRQRCEAAAGFFCFPGTFMGERQRGRLSRSPRRMLPVPDAAGDVLDPSPRHSVLRRGRGRLGPGCPRLALAKFRLLLLNERGTRQERNPNGRRQRGGGGGDGGGGLNSGIRQQKAGPLSAIILLHSDGIHPAQARREGTELRGTGSRYRGSILPYGKGIWVVEERRAQTCFSKVGSCLWLWCNPFCWEGERCCTSEGWGCPRSRCGRLGRMATPRPRCCCG